MKKLVVLLGLINFAYATTPVKIKGVLNDVSLSGSKILFAVKDNIDEAYSDGTLFIYDIASNKKSEVARIKNLDYGIKSFFIDENKVLVSSSQGITLFDLKTRTILNSVIRLDKQESIISVRKIRSTFYVTILNDRDSKLRFAEINDNFLSLKDLKTFSVNILPTDNFFDIFLLKDKFWILDNGKLCEGNGSKVFNLDFNQREGNFVVEATSKGICFLEKDSKGRKLMLLPIELSNPIIVNIPIAGDISIDTFYQTGEEKFITSSNRLFFIINEVANVVKTNTYELYSSKNVRIWKSNLHEFEITVMVN